MAATPAWLGAAEALLNRGVHASTEATALARRLGGTALRLDIEGMASIRIGALDGRLSLIGAGPSPDSPGSETADASIAGSPLALLRLVGTSGGRPARGSGVVVSGDAEIANSYRELLALARPDFEEELSRLIGDVPARRLSQFASKAAEWAHRARRTAGENIAEYLQEESRDLVNKPELDEFLQGVDALRETADRVDARIARLERRMKRLRLMRLRVLVRLLTIQRALVRHGLDDFIRATHLYSPFRFLFYLSPWTWFQRTAGDTRGERLRLALEELGPIFVKFGQALSTRRDLIPLDIADELAKLQDRVPPFGSDIAVAAIEDALGARLGDLFARFDPEPLAAASVAQVHAATLKSGEDVVVKILRPGMHAAIDLDLEVLDALAALADEYWEDARRLRPIEIVHEYRKTILDELDLMREAANAAQLKRNFAGSSLLYVPEVYWDYCRINVMVMERIHGVIVNRIDELRARGANIAKLAENGVEIFFTQVFRHNFFHADMHPGNIFVQLDDPENPRYAAVDFGIVGTLQPRDQHYLAANFLAFFDRDYARVAALHVESGWVPAGTRVDELESAVRTVCEPIFNKPLKDISFAQVLLRLFETARRFDMQIQPQLILLQKTLLNIEGLGRELYPELDLWKTARPILRAWMRERMSPRSILRKMRMQLPDTVEALKQMPQLFQTAVREATEGRSRLKVENAGMAELREELRRAARRRDASLAAGVLWLAGLIWLALVADYKWFGWVQMCAAIVLVIRIRSSRLLQKR